MQELRAQNKVVRYTVYIYSFIGVPPFCHGSLSQGLDTELQLLAAGVHVFVEKPVSVVPPEEFQSYVSAVEESARKNGCVIGVGYMFRYHPAIERIKEELSKHGRPVVALNARYSCTYSTMNKPFWWDMSKSGGPIVEQGTHFCDLVRYFGGEVVFDSITGVSVPPPASPDSAGHLSSIPQVVQAAGIPEELQVPRATQCTWRFQQGGGIGTLTHTVTLHGDRYESSLDIWCDGLRITLHEPYHPQCELRIRRSGDDRETCETFPTADPYLEEDRAFFNAVRSNDMSYIRSPYSDAAKTYQLTWAIRRATDKRSL